MPDDRFTAVMAAIGNLELNRPVGWVGAIGQAVIEVQGLSAQACVGDMVEIARNRKDGLRGEVLGITPDMVTVLPDGDPEGVVIGDRVILTGAEPISPDDSWLGRVVDPFGVALDGRPLLGGSIARPLRASAPPATLRRALGDRLETGMAVFNTVLPMVRGQRIGLFAGSGVGKSTLLANLAQGVDVDVTVIALIGERGREVREFVDHVLGPEGMKTSVVVAATSDQSALLRRRAAWAAMSIAEHFRDNGKQVLFLADSVTRFAEAHREVALAAGEAASLRGYPSTTTQTIMSLAERAGPGCDGTGDITAVFSVLVAGSDMEEPIADILRGVLDGHVVMDRQIAERGRFPAIDLLRSVSRSLPRAASAEQNKLISRTRQLLGAYERAEIMIQAGLYSHGSDPEIDAAIRVWAGLDRFLALHDSGSIETSFEQLQSALAPSVGGIPS